MDFNKNNNKKIIIPVLAVALLVVATLGATYAFFNYTRTGANNTITTGTINFSSNQTNNNLTLTNVFPIASSSVGTDTNNVAEIDINVTGDTTYSGGMEYKLTIVNPQVTATANNETVTLPLSFVIDADTTDGNTLTGLGTEQSTYFSITDTHKTNGTYPNTAMYKRIAGTTPDTVTANKDIFVGYIPADTNVNGKIKIKAFLDAERILITDTPIGNDVETDGFENGTDTSGYDVVVTTGQWNALQSSPLSFQVKVESNEGLWVENMETSSKLPTTLSLSSNSGKRYLATAKTETTITTDGDGDLSCSSNNTSIATCSITGSTLTVTGVSDGTATITVSQSEGATHSATNTTYSFTLQDTCPNCVYMRGSSYGRHKFSYNYGANGVSTTTLANDNRTLYNDYKSVLSNEIYSYNFFGLIVKNDVVDKAYVCMEYPESDSYHNYVDASEKSFCLEYSVDQAKFNYNKQLVNEIFSIQDEDWISYSDNYIYFTDSHSTRISLEASGVVSFFMEEDYTELYQDEFLNTYNT